MMGDSAEIGLSGERKGDMMDNSAEILFHSFLQEADVSTSGMSRDVHSLMLSIEHFLCQPWCCPPFKVSDRMVLDRPSRCMTRLNHVSSHLLTVTRSGSCRPTRKLILLCIQFETKCLRKLGAQDQ